MNILVCLMLLHTELQNSDFPWSFSFVFLFFAYFKDASLNLHILPLLNWAGLTVNCIFIPYFSLPEFLPVSFFKFSLLYFLSCICTLFLILFKDKPILISHMNKRVHWNSCLDWWNSEAFFLKFLFFYYYMFADIMITILITHFNSFSNYPLIHVSLLDFISLVFSCVSLRFFKTIILNSYSGDWHISISLRSVTNCRAPGVTPHVLFCVDSRALHWCLPSSSPSEMTWVGKDFRLRAAVGTPAGSCLAAATPHGSGGGGSLLRPQQLTVVQLGGDVAGGSLAVTGSGAHLVSFSQGRKPFHGAAGRQWVLRCVLAVPFRTAIPSCCVLWGFLCFSVVSWSSPRPILLARSYSLIIVGEAELWGHLLLRLTNFTHCEAIQCLLKKQAEREIWDLTVAGLRVTPDTEK